MSSLKKHSVITDCNLNSANRKKMKDSSCANTKCLLNHMDFIVVSVPSKIELNDMGWVALKKVFVLLITKDDSYRKYLFITCS